jgi:hypothetical protein
MGGGAMGWVLAVAGVAFGAAMAMLVVFLVTDDARYDRVAEWCFVAFGVLGAPSILVLGGRLPGVVGTIATVLGVVGAAGVGLGELATATGLADFRRIGPLVTGAFLALLAWIGLVSLLIVGGTEFPVALGWLGIASIVGGLVIVAWAARLPGVLSGGQQPPRSLTLTFLVPAAGITLWMIGLGWSWSTLVL